MKINGEKITGTNFKYIVIPRPEKDIVFKVEAILNEKEFELLCPIPKPPKKLMPGGKTVIDTESKAYLDEVNTYATRKTHWMILKSLSATAGLDWEKVDKSRPETWHLFEEEMNEAGFCTREIQLILEGIFEVNALNEAKIEEARQRFLRSREEDLNGLSSLNSEQKNTLSGDAANVSVLSPQT